MAQFHFKISVVSVPSSLSSPQHLVSRLLHLLPRMESRFGRRRDLCMTVAQRIQIGIYVSFRAPAKAVHRIRRRRRRPSSTLSRDSRKRARIGSALTLNGCKPYFNRKKRGNSALLCALIMQDFPNAACSRPASIHARKKAPKVIEAVLLLLRGGTTARRRRRRPRCSRHGHRRSRNFTAEKSAEARNELVVMGRTRFLMIRDAGGSLIAFCSVTKSASKQSFLRIRPSSKMNRRDREGRRRRKRKKG